MRKFSALPVAALPSAPLVGQESAGGADMIATVVTSTDRTNSVYITNYTSNGVLGAVLYGYMNNDPAIARQWLNIARGDLAPNSQQRYGFGDSGEGIVRRVQYAHRQRVGYSRQIPYRHANATSQPGHTVRVLPLRNTTNAAINVNVNMGFSNTWGDGTGGAGLAVFTPNAGKYSEVTTGTWTFPFAATSNLQTQHNNASATVTVPANTTVLVMLVSTIWYGTTYQFSDTNYFYDLWQTFQDPGIICDMRMLSMLACGITPNQGDGNAEDTFRLYNKTSQLYGDR